MNCVPIYLLLFLAKIIFMKLNYLHFITLSVVALLASCTSDDNAFIQHPDDQLIIADDQASALIQPTGFYIANEDWFGHDHGTINFFKNYQTPEYRIFRNANPNDSLGITTQFGVAYADYYFLISKQKNRLVVTDKNFKKKKIITETNGDGRSFVGVNANKGYLGTSKGISIFDINTMQISGTINGIDDQVGNMISRNNNVYAIVQSVGLLIINSETDEIKQKIEGNFTQMTIDKNGVIWAATEQELFKIDKQSDQFETISIAEAPIYGTWFAWNAGSLCASMQTNTLYWIAGGGSFGGHNKVVQFDTETKTLNTNFYTLGEEENSALEFYGAGLRVDPVKDDLILMVKKNGWGENGSYNWVQIVSKDGVLKNKISVKGGGSTLNENYYWFPSMPFFQDNNHPEILVNQFIVAPEKEQAFSLSNYIIDQDNPVSLISVKIKSIEPIDLAEITVANDEILFKTGTKEGVVKFTLEATSNGKKVTKEIRLDIRKK